MRALAFVIALSHLLLLAAIHWIVFDQFRLRTPDNAHESLATGFTAYSTRVVGMEVLAIAVMCALASSLIAPRERRDRGSVITALLMAHAPVAAYSLATLAAFLAGWELDVLVLASGDATPADVARTIEAAIPVVLEPLSWGRHLANAAAVVFFTMLQRRLFGTSAGRSALVAAAIGGIMTVTHLIVTR